MFKLLNIFQLFCPSYFVRISTYFIIDYTQRGNQSKRSRPKQNDYAHKEMVDNFANFPLSADALRSQKQMHSASIIVNVTYMASIGSVAQLQKRRQNFSLFNFFYSCWREGEVVNAKITNVFCLEEPRSSNNRAPPHT